MCGVLRKVLSQAVSDPDSPAHVVTRSSMGVLAGWQDFYHSAGSPPVLGVLPLNFQHSRSVLPIPYGLSVDAAHRETEYYYDEGARYSVG